MKFMKKQMKTQKSFLGFNENFNFKFINCNQEFVQDIKKQKTKSKEFAFILGVSGGPDSTLLLHLVCEQKKDLEKQLGIRINIYVIHINHMLRENAKLDEMFTKSLCNKLGVSFYLRKVNIKNTKKSIEEEGRNKRREAFINLANKLIKEKYLKENIYIFTAHHQNDQVETILMRVLRGTGFLGLIGISKFKKDERIGFNFVRPLLCFKKEEIDKYLKQNKIDFRIDESNNNSIYTRNKIRNKLIPYINKNFNTNIHSSLIKLNDSVIEANEYLKAKIERAYKKGIKNKTIILSNNEIRFSLKIFSKDDLMGNAFLLKQFILYFFTILGLYDYSKVHIDSLINAIKKNVGNKKIEFPNHFYCYIKGGVVSIKKENIKK